MSAHPGKQEAQAINKAVGHRLRTARVVADVTQKVAAARLGLTLQQLQKYEDGTNRASAGVLAILAKLYQRPVSWFFEDSPGANSGSTAADPVTAMLNAPHGLRLAEAFLSIAHGADRATVTAVAEAIARAPAAQLKQVG